MADRNGLYPTPEEWTSRAFPPPEVQVNDLGKITVRLNSGLVATVSHIQKRRHQLNCELRIQVPMQGIVLPPRRINLLSDNATSSLKRALKARLPEQPWEEAIDDIITAADNNSNIVNPPVRLKRVSQGTEIPWAIDPLVGDRQPMLLYADGGSGKTMLAMAIGVQFATGWQFVPGIYVPDPGPVLYLDWEDTEEAQEVTYSRIVASTDAEIENFVYMECRGPLHELADMLRDRVLEIKARLVIVDSVSWAAGDDIESQATVGAYAEAIRQLDVTNISIAHVRKDDDGKPFGSTHWWNWPRQIWMLQRHSEQGSQVANLQMIHKKANKHGLRPPLGLRMDFSSWPIRFTRIDPGDVNEFRRHQGSTGQIREIQDYLTAVVRATDVQIAEETGIGRGTVRRLIGRIPEVQTSYEGQTAVRWIPREEEEAQGW